MKEKVEEMASKIGLATKAEMDELKNMMKELNEKIDSLKK